MRVIAGSAKGTRLATVPAGTRPLSDRAREGLFSSLGPAVVGAQMADLFAGTGAVGIEALSRGAARCDLVDSSPAAVRAIRENLGRTALTDRATVVRSDVRSFLARSPGPYDLAFLDPPYALAEGVVRDAVAAAAARLVPDVGILVLTRPSRNPSDVIPVHLHVAKRLAYGDALVLVCREGS